MENKPIPPLNEGKNVPEAESLSVSQARSDLADRDELNGAIQALSRALGDPTRREIYLWLRDQGTVTVQQVAHQFSLHPNVARHHLDRLAASGYVETFITRLESQVGRPSKKYRVLREPSLLEGLTDQATLLAALLGRFMAELSPERVEVLAYETGFEYGRDIAKAMNGEDATKTVSASLTLVADALTRSGFATHVDSEAMALTNHCCPFGKLVRNFPVLCATERGLIEGLVQALTRDGKLVTVEADRNSDTCNIRLRRI